jgi:MFS family permease
VGSELHPSGAKILSGEPQNLRAARQRRPAWLNRNVAGMSVTSFFSDAGHEMVTAVLPGFLGVIGVPAGVLGWIEGGSDAAASFVKLGAGWYSDRIGSRKAMVTAGYFLTGTALALFAAAVSWPLILLGRLIAWIGRGIRAPLRDAMLSDSVSPDARGKAFGLHRAGDTLGAVIGPLIGVGCLSLLPASSASGPFRIIFLFSLVPGLASVAAFAGLVRENKSRGQKGLRFWGALSNLPYPYRRFLTGVGVFGLGDFSHTLLILAATQLVAPERGPVAAAQWAAGLYVIRNLFYAGASFPIGFLADRISKTKLLAAGYLLGACTAMATSALFVFHASRSGALAAVFAAAGFYIAMEDALEGAIPADLVPSGLRGVGYGVMGTVNGVGDLAASALVGTLWTAVSPAAAFGAAALLMLLGAALVLRNHA